jgi:hypothetical protein
MVEVTSLLPPPRPPPPQELTPPTSIIWGVVTSGCEVACGTLGAASRRRRAGARLAEGRRAACGRVSRIQRETERKEACSCSVVVQSFRNWWRWYSRSLYSKGIDS